MANIGLKRRRLSNMSLQYAVGVTSKSTIIQVVDDSGLAVTGLVAATLPTTSYWIFGANSSVSISLSDLSTITTAYSSGGVKELSGGYYRLDVPNTPLSVAGKFKIIGEASGKHIISEIIDVGYPQVDLRQIFGTSITDTTGQSSAAFSTFFNVASPTLTCATLTESYAADGATFSVSQALYEICQALSEFTVSGTSVTVKKRDGTTTAAVYTLDDALNPTSRTRTS